MQLAIKRGTCDERFRSEISREQVAVSSASLYWNCSSTVAAQVLGPDFPFTGLLPPASRSVARSFTSLPHGVAGATEIVRDR